MDIPRESQAGKRRRRRLLWGGAGLAAIVLITVGLSRLEPAAPSVERATLWTNKVKRGEMLRQVRGAGTLVPKEIRWISANTDGRVESRLVEPGSEVESSTVILVLANPELEQERQDAELALKAEEAQYKNLQVKLDSDRLDQQASAAQVNADYEAAKLDVDANTQLSKDGLVPEINLKRSQLQEAQLKIRHEIEEKRLLKNLDSITAQLDAERARLDQLSAAFELKKQQVESLHVRAGIAGVLQQVPVEVGQRVTPGTTLAKVAQPNSLKAELQIPQTQAKDLLIGQNADIDTRNGIVPGHVSRIDPAVREGTVTVDVELKGDLPKGARPDLSVDGTIEIERLPDVLYVGRPAFGQADSTVELFKVIDGGSQAVRVPVKLGKSSVNTIEVVEGLQEGDEVILSDTSQFDNVDRIRLN